MVEGKTLWVFGDSTSRNHGLLATDEHYKAYKGEKKYFSEYIREHFNLKNIKNFARHGASNEDILFILLSNISSISKGDVVLLQKTYSSRVNFYDDNNMFTPCHLAINADYLNFNIKNKVITDTLKKYIKYYVVDNTENFNSRDVVKFYNLKKLIEKINAKCILWDSSILDESNLILNTITFESNGTVSDPHIGFKAQKILAEELITNFENKIEFLYYNSHNDTLQDYSRKIKQYKRLVGNITDTGYEVEQ